MLALLPHVREYYHQAGTMAKLIPPGKGEKGDKLRKLGAQALLLSELLDTAECYDVENVARWTRTNLLGAPTEGGQKLGDITKSLPNVAPVARTMWCEFPSTHPGLAGTGAHQGALIEALAERTPGGTEIEDFCAIYEGTEIPDQYMRAARWVIGMMPFMYRSNPLPGQHKLWQSDYLVHVLVGPEGEQIALAFYANPFCIVPSSNLKEAFQEEYLVSMATLNFLHCTNVVTTEHYAPRQARRQAERSGKPAPVKYKVLDVGPTVRSGAHLSAAGTRGGMALHTVRGKFHRYGVDGRGLLFGKYTGLFYKPQHTRGSPQAGRVVKTYRAHPQQPAAASTEAHSALEG